MKAGIGTHWKANEPKGLHRAAVARSHLACLASHERDAAARVLEDSKSDVSWGNQIRSYVLDQSRIKDLRTDVEFGDTGKVLDGHLDPFMEASLKAGL